MTKKCGREVWEECVSAFSKRERERCKFNSDDLTEIEGERKECERGCLIERERAAREKAKGILREKIKGCVRKRAKRLCER